MRRDTPPPRISGRREYELPAELAPLDPARATARGGRPGDGGRDPRSRRSRRPRRNLLPLVLVVVLVSGAAAAIALMAPRDAEQARAGLGAVWSSVATETVQTDPGTPTPYFASFRDVKLRLPVTAESANAIAFHRTAYSDSYPLVPLVSFRNASEVKAEATAARERDEEIRATPTGTPAADAEGVWTGSALELWRTGVRGGKRYSAADCGADAGSPVYSPVDGTVMRIHPYHLYGKYDDIEIQIKPDAWDDVDVFILHVTDVAVVEGQRVVAGVTPIAHVRKLSSVVSGLQLRSYTTDGGNHAHIQFNKVPEPDQPWLVGSDPPGFERHGD